MTTTPALGDLHVQACGLAHEGRRGAGALFCPKAVRAGNLACAHTMARYTLLDALRAREAAGLAGAGEDLAEWQTLDVAVGLADHARSQAEKAGDRAGVAAAIAAHDACARRLEALLATVRGDGPPLPA